MVVVRKRPVVILSMACQIQWNSDDTVFFFFLLVSRMHRLTSQGTDDPQVADGRQMSQVEDTGFNFVS